MNVSNVEIVDIHIRYANELFYSGFYQKSLEESKIIYCSNKNKYDNSLILIECLYNLGKYQEGIKISKDNLSMLENKKTVYLMH